MTTPEIGERSLHPCTKGEASHTGEMTTAELGSLRRPGQDPGLLFVVSPVPEAPARAVPTTKKHVRKPKKIDGAHFYRMEESGRACIKSLCRLRDAIQRELEVVENERDCVDFAIRALEGSLDPRVTDRWGRGSHASDESRKGPRVS